MPTPAWVQAVCAKVPEWEGNIPWLYLDNARTPNATTGQGYLVSSRQASLMLPWLHADGTPAGPSDITEDWLRVTALPGGKVSGYYQSPTGLLLSQDSINAMTSSKVEALVGPLHELYPAFDSFPLSAQTAIGDMGYGLGVGRPAIGDEEATGLHDYMHFNMAVNSNPPDWKTAAQESGRNTWMASFKLRNEWTAQLFLQAAQGE